MGMWLQSKGSIIMGEWAADFRIHFGVELFVLVQQVQ
jgi:hypothetical protein